MNNSKSQLREYLKELFLSENEISIYFACLELGEASIVPIRSKVSLPRTTVFRALENLQTVGIVNIIETPTGRIYRPNPPQKIVTLLAEQAKNFQEKADNMKGLLPELNKIYNLSPLQPKTKLFIGKEIEQIFNDVIEEPTKELLYIGELGKLSHILNNKFYKGWLTEKAKKGIAIRFICVGKASDFDPNDTTNMFKMRLAPKDYQSPAHLLIYSNTVVSLTSGRENFGLVVTSNEFATTMKNTFNELWKASKEIK